MKPKYNAFLTYWPWLLPIGILLWTAALMLRHFHVLPDYWAGFMLGFSSFLALIGAGMLIARICRQKRPEMKGATFLHTVTYSREVYYYETDRMDCVHHSNYIRWFEEARVHFMREMGFPYDKLEASGIVSPVLHADADYRAMCRFGEQVEIAAGIESYTGTRIGFFYAVTDKATGALRCQGRTLHCFINETGRPVSLRKANPAYDARVRELLED